MSTVDTMGGGYNTAEKLLANVTADHMALTGGGGDMTAGEGTGGAGGGEMGGALKDVLKELMPLLNKLIEALSGGGTQGGSGAGGGGGAGGTGDALQTLKDAFAAAQQVQAQITDGVIGGGMPPGGGVVNPGDVHDCPHHGGGGGGSGDVAEDEVIAGSGRIWGDPHFVGQDGGKYDVQGEAGKTYNLLSDQNFQMNGQFDQYKNKDGLTVVGAVGIAAGSDQIEVHKSGSVMVNGEALRPGDRVELEDGGFVEYKANGKGVTIESGEWNTDISFQNKGHSNKAHLNIDVSTENALADGVKPHGLLGQTFDTDNDARNGDQGKGTQGGGAIEGTDGAITERGDRETVELYEVDNLHDRNFTEFNQFFDEVEAGEPGQYDAELDKLMAQAFGMMAQSMMLMMQMNRPQPTS